MNKLEKYIEFTLLKAAKLSSNDKLVIWCSKEQAVFAEKVKSSAVDIGIVETEIFYTDNNIELSAEKILLWKNNQYKLLWIYSDKCTSCPPIPWTTVNVATESWAHLIFPNEKNIKSATEKLWEAIFTACRIDNGNPIENWDNHIKNLTDKADKLNSFNFHGLRIKNSIGTDLNLKLIQNHKWITCTVQNKFGETVITNIPTEEVFTSPDTNSLSGTVYSTKPLFYNDEIIENFHLVFENGRITDCNAAKNAHLLKELINSHKGADHIGEIAIVPHSCPVSQLGLFWYDTSFDENAGCHLALGYSYPQTVKDYKSYSPKDLSDMGFNTCDIHQDFVIGSEDMEITGISQDLKEILIFKNGEWNI